MYNSGAIKSTLACSLFIHDTCWQWKVFMLSRVSHIRCAYSYMQEHITTQAQENIMSNMVPHTNSTFFAQKSAVVDLVKELRVTDWTADSICCSQKQHGECKMESGVSGQI